VDPDAATLLHGIEPEPWSVVPHGRGVCAGLYRALGFAWAQGYDDVAACIRRPPIGADR
jgi:hypothetical protein